MARTILGIAVILGVGIGGYWLGKSPTPQENRQESLVIPESVWESRSEEEASDPIMRKMIENHFQPLADWKGEQ